MTRAIRTETIRRRLVFRRAIVVVLASVHASTPARAQIAPDFARARQIIRDGMAKDSVPAVTIAVARDGRLLWEEAFGFANRERRIAATVHTPFHLASVSKTITTTAMMLLHERRRLELDRPANDYLGDAKLWRPGGDARGATVRALATHTAGLTTFDLACALPSGTCDFPSDDDIIRHYAVLVWPPGAGFDYSNLGYLVLGDIVARAAERDLGAFFRDEIFRPLGMTDASLGVDPRRAERTAIRYHWVYGALPNMADPVSGASSVYASVHDLVRFGMMHAKAFPRGMRAILSHGSIDSMQRSTVAVGGGSQRYGLGWWVQDDHYGYRSVLAQGGTPATQAWLRMIPSERVVVAVLANKGVEWTGDVVDAAIAAVLPRYASLWDADHAQRTAQSSPPPSPATRASVDSAFVGTWRGSVRAEAGNVPLVVTLDDSGSVHATLASTSRVGRARSDGAGLRLALPGDLVSTDSMHRLTFHLIVRDSVAVGPVTAPPPASSNLVGQLSYWVELRKQD